MKASELRIGNLISLSFMKSKTCKVVGIDYHKIWYEIDECINFTVLPYIEPIPLTEEWLIKCGFEKIGVNFSLIEFIIYTRNKDKTLVYRDTRYTIELKHVHQLQNLYFALTQKELEIK